MNIFRTLLLMLLGFLATPSFSQSDISISPISIVLDPFSPDSMGRNDIATASFTVFFARSGETLEHADRELMEIYASNLRVFDTVSLGELPIRINLIRYDFSTDGSEAKVEGIVTIPGKITPFLTSATGRTLLIVLEGGDPSLTTSPSLRSGRLSTTPRRLAVSGLTNFEWLIGAIVLFYLLAVVGFVRYRRNRLLRRNGLEDQLIEAKEQIKASERQVRSAQQLEEKVQSTPRRARPMKPVPDVPEQVLQALVSGQAVLGVGGGLAQEAGRPSWQQILRDLHDVLKDQLSPSVNRLFIDMIAPSRREISVDDLSDLMDAVTSNVKRVQLIAEIQAIVERRPEDTTLYRLLARLPWAGALSLAIDGVGLEELNSGLNERKTASDQDIVMFPTDGRALRDAVRLGDPFLVKALGDLKVPDTVSLSLNEMRQTLSRSPEFTRQMPLLFDTQCFLFVCVSPDEVKEYMQLFNPGYRPDTPKHFVLTAFDEGNDRFVDTLARYGVELLEYDDQAEEDALAAFIRNIREGLTSLEASSGLEHFSDRRVNTQIASQKIQTLKLNNIGPFGNLEIDFRQPEVREISQWTVILGENGVGKTGILRSIALALTAGESGVQRLANSVLKHGEERGHIELELQQQSVEVELIRNRSQDVKVIAGQTSPVEAGQLLVLGFPALRGAPSLEPGGPSSSTLLRRPPEPSDLTPILSGEIDPRMSDFKQWIINILNNSESDSRVKEIRTLLDDIVRTLVPGGFAGFEDLDLNHVICLKPIESGQEPVPFSTVSQGMSSIFNWIGVLAKRLYEFYELDGDILPHMRHAIVLIDEIDVHLHPDWQRRLVTLTKDFFPNVQVIATTHSPMIAGSLARNEIQVIERFGQGQFGARKPTAATKGKSADFILQSDVIGLGAARSLEVEEKIVDYQRLYSKFEREESEDVELAKLTKELADVGWSGVFETPPEKATIETLENIISTFDKK